MPFSLCDGGQDETITFEGEIGYKTMLFLSSCSRIHVRETRSAEYENLATIASRTIAAPEKKLCTPLAGCNSLSLSISLCLYLYLSVLQSKTRRKTKSKRNTRGQLTTHSSGVCSPITTYGDCPKELTTGRPLSRPSLSRHRRLQGSALRASSRYRLSAR